MSERNEAGDRIDGAANPPIPPPPIPAPRGLPDGAMGFNDAGDPVFAPPQMRAGENEAGDRYDGRVSEPLAPDPTPLPRGIPPEAIGANEAGDPIFPGPGGGSNEAGDQIPGTQSAFHTGSPPPACPSCGGVGKKRYVDSRGMTATMACQDCGGLGFASAT